jgi:hypothetical protein
MGDIGQCLLFWLRYPAEMERLYVSEEPNVEGLPNPDEILKRVEIVGDTACRQGGDLLRACVTGIEAHFSPIIAIERVRNDLSDTWELKFRVSATRRCEIGVIIDPHRAALFPWVWCRGGRRVEDEVIRTLGRGFRQDAFGLEWFAGTVALARIPIPIPAKLDELVPRAPLVEQVCQAFSFFSAENVATISAIASNRGEA